MSISKLILSAAFVTSFAILGCNSDKNAHSDVPGHAIKGATIQQCEDMESGDAPKPQTVQAGTHWGPEFKLADKDIVTAAQVLANPTEYNGKYIRIKGQVTDVCQVKGCWFTFGDPKNQETVFVKFTDPPSGRLLPLSAPGHDVIIEGNFKIAQVSESFAKHLAGEGGKPQGDVSKIVGPQKKLIIADPAVTMVGVTN